MAMKRHRKWFVIPTTLATFLTLAGQASSQTIQTPLQSKIEVSGVSGGSESSSCGFISNTPNQVLQVTEPFAPLDIRVTSTGDFTLFISGPNGFSECVMANNYDQGVISAPGLLNQGAYSIFVGDLNGQSNPYRLSIEQN
ncbi:MAG: hypothetical protein MJA27_31030 [Pseudanabaenales cyanobacterium]|nr:hypothetical protein [Pseudanabaenales cyanobacterium]